MSPPSRAITKPSDGTAWQSERDEARRELFATIDQMQAAFADVPLAEIEREVARAIAAVRREDRARTADLGER